MTATIHPVSPVLGAEIEGIDLAGGVTDEEFAFIHRAFLDYGVVFFRNQAALPPDVQVAFAERLGPVHRHPAAPSADVHPSIFVIHAHRGSKVANGNGWHTDVSCDAAPPLATMLQVRQIPEGGGGDTLFACMEAAYAALPSDWQEKLRGLSAVHASEHVYRGRYADRGVDDAGETYPSAVHPVIRTHPETGRPSIYVNRSFTTEIVGADPNEGRTLLRRVLAHVERPEFQIRFRWRQNDVALWDNRRLQHFAVWDYWPAERLGHRVSVRGDRPFFDPGGPDAPPSTLRVSAGGLTGHESELDHQETS